MIKQALLIVSLVLFAQACASKVSAKIVYFYDGDTVKVDDGKDIYKLRIVDIDAPERNQPYGKKARRALMKLCENAQIEVILQAQKDRYQRRLGQLYCDTQSVAHYMASQGHAWSQGKRYTQDMTVLDAAKTARAQKLGLWAAENPIPPWKWRKHFQTQD